MVDGLPLVTMPFYWSRARPWTRRVSAAPVACGITAAIGSRRFARRSPGRPTWIDRRGGHWQRGSPPAVGSAGAGAGDDPEPQAASITEVATAGRQGLPTACIVPRPYGFAPRIGGGSASGRRRGPRSGPGRFCRTTRVPTHRWRGPYRPGRPSPPQPEAGGGQPAARGSASAGSGRGANHRPAREDQPGGSEGRDRGSARFRCRG